MKKLIILFTIFLISTSLTPLSFAFDGARLGPADVPQGVLREGVLSIKFLDAYFGTDGSKIEVAPGDRNVPFTVIMSNVGTQDITLELKENSPFLQHTNLQVVEVWL